MFDASIGREYNEYVVFDFFNHQLVCHYAPNEIPEKVTMYPRHFGLIFDSMETFDRIYDNCKKYNATFFKERFERFREKPGWHHSFFVVDPSNNLIEIKFYENQNDIFGAAA